jgi:hypothetical protein
MTYPSRCYEVQHGNTQNSNNPQEVLFLIAARGDHLRTRTYKSDLVLGEVEHRQLRHERE